MKFFQRHGLDHGGVTLAPRLSDPRHPFESLEFDQKKARDPLDPICWHILTLLAGYGSLFVRRCRYWKCQKFFVPRTPRKKYCSDSCRALRHAFEEFQKNPKKYRKERAEFMKQNRAIKKKRREASKLASLRTNT